MYALPLLRPGRCMSRVERSLHAHGSRNLLRPIRLRRYLIAVLFVLPLLATFPLQTAARAQDVVGPSLLSTPDARAQDVVGSSLLLAPDARAQDVVGTSLLSTPDARAQDAVGTSLLSTPDAAADTVVTVTLSIPDAEADEADVSNTAEIVLTLDSPLGFNESLGIPLNFSGGTLDTDFTLQEDVLGVTLQGRLVTFYGGSLFGNVQKVTVVLTPILDSDDTNDVVTVSIPTSVYTGGLSPDPNFEAKGVRVGNGEITLLDAARPLASFAAAATSAGEGAGTRNVRVNLSPAPTSAITLAYAVGGTATAGTDYVRLSGSIQVSANANSVNIPVSITDDSTIESNETVTLTLTSATSYRLGLPSKHTLTIEDDDSGGSTPEASFSSSSSSGAEGGGTQNVQVNLSPAPQSSITIAYTVGGTASSGSDYTRLSGSVQASANATSVNIPVSITDDALVEADETVVLTLTSGTGYELGSTTKHTLTITDNDSGGSTPQASFEFLGSSATEGAGAVNAQVNLSPAPQSPITITYTVGGTASSGSDYTRLSGSVQASANATSVIIPVSITDDGLVEGDETVVLTLTSGTGYELGSTTRHTLTITDNDSGGSTPQASFEFLGASATEGAGAVNVQVNLSPAPQSAITITYTVGGTATSGSDYAPLPGSVQASANATSVIIPVSITDDALEESAETVVLTLTSGTGYELGSTTKYTLTITDNDSGGGSTPLVRFSSSSSSGAEDVGTQNVQVNLSPAPQSSITIAYTVVGGTASSGADYTRLPGSVQASANATSVNIPVSITDDALVEGDETVVLTLASGTGYTRGSPSAHTLTITDNDSGGGGGGGGGGSTPSVRFSSSSSSAAEDVGTHNVQVNLSPAPQSSITIAYTVGGTASSGSDYTRLSGSVQALANATSVNIPVSITDDALVEDAETVVLTLASGTGYTRDSPSVHTLTITDNDNDSGGGGGVGGGTPQASFSSSSSSGAEDVGTQNVQVNLSPAPQSSITIAYTVGGTASSGTDYTRLSGSVQASANATSVNIPVSITDDALVEDAETVVLTLASGTGYTVGSPSAHTLTITDNDNDNDSGGGGGGGGGGAPSVSFETTLSGAAEDAGTQNVQVNLSPAPQSSITIAYTVGGTALSGADKDYTPLSGSVSAAANATSVNIPLTLADDMLDENDETVVLTLTSGVGYAVGLSNVHTFVIQDDDAGPAARFAAASSGASEGAGAQSVTVSLFPVPQSDVTLSYTVTGTASSGEDYASLSGSVQVLAQATSVDIPLEIMDDALAEGDETVVLRLNSGTGYTAGLPDEHLFVIRGDDGAPAVIITGGPPVTEGESASFMLTTTPAASNLEVTVMATEIGDFGVGSWTTSILSHWIEFSVDTIDDNISEADGLVRMTLDIGAGYTLGSPSSAAVMVMDNDAPPLSAEPADPEIPAAFALEQNYPNPFNPSTTIRFSLARAQRVRLLVYDMLGQEVRVLMDGVQPAGRHRVAFDASGLASGAYLYVLRTEEQAAVKTMALLK